MAAVSLSTLDSAIGTRISAQLSGFTEVNTVASLLRAPSSIIDKGFVIRLPAAVSLDGSSSGLRQAALSRIQVDLTIEFSRKINPKSQATTRRTAEGNCEHIVKALIDRAWTGALVSGSGGPRFVFRNYRLEYSELGEAVIGIILFSMTYELSLA